MAYAIGYCVHTWEMFTVRSWVVTFLVFTAAQTGSKPDFFIPTVVAMLMELFGTAEPTNAQLRISAHYGTAKADATQTDLGDPRFSDAALDRCRERVLELAASWAALALGAILEMELEEEPEGIAPDH